VVEGKTLPLIAHQSEHGLVVEALIAGTPLLVTLMGTGAHTLSRDDYPWTAWSRASRHDTWTSHLAQGTHFLVGVMVIALLLIVIATRRQASRDPVQPGAAVTIGTILRSAFGGMLGFGRDSFTRFPPPPDERGRRPS
jgi:hypothetical protein